ncbi:MAG: protein kinase [Polyangiales bacterium]
MNPPRSNDHLARGDAQLAARFATRTFTFERWLRQTDTSQVVVVHDDDARLVLKVGEASAIEREFTATRELNHGAIVRPTQYLQGDTFSALLMPYFEGSDIVDGTRRWVPERLQTLRQNLPMAFGYEMNDLGENSFAHCGEEGERLLRPWLHTLVDVLTYIHARRRLHLDIAPDNILVRGAQCVLLDFGLSSDLDQTQTDEGLIGSAAYLAPELGLRSLTPAADWYSLGVVLFQALSGGLPFEGGGPEVLVRKQSMNAPRVSELCPEVAPDLDELCASWLARDPKRRGDGRALLAVGGSLTLPSP